MKTTGTLKYNTARHSAQFSGVIANNDCTPRTASASDPHSGRKKLTVKNGMYRIAKCSAMLSAIAPTRNMLRQMGSLSSDSFSESEFIALNISTVTRIERLIVVARCAITFVNIAQPTSGKSAAHLWKCVCGEVETGRVSFEHAGQCEDERR